MTLDPLDADMVIEAQTAACNTLQSHDIAYMVLIGPDKHSIYPEHLPLSCRLGQGPSMLDQIFSVMAENQLPFSDPRAALMAAKETAPTDLYWHTDTHWNELGGWVAYNHLMDSLAPIVPALHRVQAEDFTATPCDFSGDLAGMIGMAGIYVEKTMTCAFHDEAQIQVDGSLCNEMFTVYRNHALPEGPTVVLRHDSFGEAIIPFLARSAGLLYTTTSEELPLPAILEAQADLVLVEYVERDALGLGNVISEEEW